MNNSTVVTALLFVVACISTAGFVQERLDKEASSKTLENNVSVLTENVEKLAAQQVELVSTVEEIRTEVDANKAFDLLTNKRDCVSMLIKIKEATGYDGDKLKELAGDICKSINIEMDGQGRYWLIECPVAHKFYREEK